MNTQAKPLTLTMDRTYDASPARVFRAWTRSEEIVHWVAPNPEMETSAELDVREGGSYVIHMGPYTVRGTYEEIVPDRKLVFTWRWDGAEHVEPMLVTVALEETAGGGTKMRVFHERFPTEQERDNHNQGWTGSFARLEEYLTSRA